MNISSGSILISSPSMNDDPYFGKAVVFIVEHNEKGSLGFVLNKLFGRKFNDLAEFKHSKPFPLYAGGPVERDSLFLLHKKLDVIVNSLPVTGQVGMGGDFKQVVALMDDKIITEDDVKLFIGYSGWDYGQLEAEINEGSWLVVDAPPQTIFSTRTAFLWEELFERKTLLSFN